MKKTILALIFVFLLIPLASASFGVFKVDECVDLLQTCQDCSYVTISSVTMPDSSTAIGNPFLIT